MWREEIRLDVREMDESGRLTQKGVSLGPEKIKKFYTAIRDATSAVTRLRNGDSVQFKADLGGGVFMRVETPFRGVDLRQFFHPHERDETDSSVEWKPTKRGIFLTVQEWVDFCRFCYTVIHELTTLCNARPESPPSPPAMF